MAKRSAGIAGSAVLAGTAGLWLAYVGIKDVPFFDGLRQLLRQENPTPRTQHAPYKPSVIVPAGGELVPGAKAGRDIGITQLKGNVASGYQVIRQMGDWQILGWGIRADLSSDHPKGLAIDVMKPTAGEAQQIIARFKGLPGAKYWIWQRQIANTHVDNWRIRPYHGPNPHTDHVHLSWE